MPDKVHMCTMGGAYAQGREHTTGSIEPGKQADFIVIDQDIFAVPVHEVHRTRVLRTVVRGQTVYDQANAADVIDFQNPDAATLTEQQPQPRSP